MQNDKNKENTSKGKMLQIKNAVYQKNRERRIRGTIQIQNPTQIHK